MAISDDEPIFGHYKTAAAAGGTEFPIILRQWLDKTKIKEKWAGTIKQRPEFFINHDTDNCRRHGIHYVNDGAFFPHHFLPAHDCSLVFHAPISGLAKQCAANAARKQADPHDER